MDNQEKLATFVTQETRRRQTKQKHNTICVGHHYAQANTNNVNKTWTLLQTTESKDAPNIFFMWKSSITSQHGTQNVKKYNRTTQKTKKMNYTAKRNKCTLWFSESRYDLNVEYVVLFLSYQAWVVDMFTPCL